MSFQGWRFYPDIYPHIETLIWDIPYLVAIFIVDMTIGPKHLVRGEKWQYNTEL